MASARQAQLLEQRSRYSVGSRFGNTRRVLSPNSLAGSVNTIAKKSLEAEFSNMKKLYDDGQVGTEELRNFVKRYAASDLLTEQERVDANNVLRDLDVAVGASQVESGYKNAQTGTQQKADSAKAVANYYTRLASSMIPGTQAFYDVMSKVGQWTNTAKTEQDSVNRVYRQRLRAQNDLKVAQQPDNSIEELQAKYNSYVQMASEARADGQENEALKYETLAQNVSDNLPVLQTKLQVKDIRGVLNDLANKYHDGKINEDEYLSALFEVGNRADLTGDAGLISTVNRTTDVVYKNKELGGLNRGSTSDGLPVVIGKKGASTVSDWDADDNDFKADMKTIMDSPSTGVMPDGSPFTMAAWSQKYANAMKLREEELTRRADILMSKSPGDKIYYGGKKTSVENVLETVRTELEVSSGLLLGDKTQDGGIANKIVMLQSNRVVPIMIGPQEFNASGDPRENSRSVAKIDFVYANNLNNLPSNQWAKDSMGVYHKVKPETRNLTPGEAAKVVNGYLFDGKKSVPVKYDQSGNPYIFTGNQVADVYIPNTSFKVTRQFAPGQALQGPTNEELKGFGLYQDPVVYGPQMNETGTPVAQPIQTPVSTPKPEANNVAKIENKQVAPQTVLRAVPKIDTQVSQQQAENAGQAYQDYAKQIVKIGLEKPPEVNMPEVKIPEMVPNMSQAFQTEQSPTGLKLATPTPTLKNINTDNYNLYLGPQGNLEQGGQAIKIPDSSKTDPANLPKDPFQAIGQFASSAVNKVKSLIPKIKLW